MGQKVHQSLYFSIFHRALLFITHSLAFSADKFVHKEFSLGPTNIYELAPWATQAHEPDLHQARGQHDTPRGRPDVTYHLRKNPNPNPKLFVVRRLQQVGRPSEIPIRTYVRFIT